MVLLRNFLFRKMKMKFQLFVGFVVIGMHFCVQEKPYRISLVLFYYIWLYILICKEDSLNIWASCWRSCERMMEWKPSSYHLNWIIKKRKLSLALFHSGEVLSSTLYLWIKSKNRRHTSNDLLYIEMAPVIVNERT